MIDIKLIRENPNLVKENIKKKFQDYKIDLVDKVLELDKKNREVKLNGDDLRMNRNSLSSKIGLLMKDGKIIELTKNEYKILKYLVQNREKIVSREDIMECLWESESFIDDNTLTVNITRLRNKLEELELKELLETKRGQGYILKKGVN